jgi:hypothetical protein
MSFSKEVKRLLNENLKFSITCVSIFSIETEENNVSAEMIALQKFVIEKKNDTNQVK